MVPWESGIRLLGVPVGSLTFASESVAKVVVKLSGGLGLLEQLGCPQSALHILRLCLGSSPIPCLLRALPYALGAELARAVTPVLQRTLGVIVGLPLLEEQWSLARLPCRLGSPGFLYPSVCPESAEALKALLFPFGSPKPKSTQSNTFNRPMAARTHLKSRKRCASQKKEEKKDFVPDVMQRKHT